LYCLSVEEVPAGAFISGRSAHISILHIVFAMRKLKCLCKFILLVIRKGSDVTLTGWGAQLAVLEQACEDAAKVTCLRKFLNTKLN
jgi:hypothetical protein